MNACFEFLITQQEPRAPVADLEAAQTPSNGEPGFRSKAPQVYIGNMRVIRDIERRRKNFLRRQETVHFFDLRKTPPRHPEQADWLYW